MFGAEMYQLFKQIKTIFDPQNIFNPGKKVGGTLEYLEQHLAKK
jgi:FAD/FMN-containing dehydrogenase